MRLKMLTATIMAAMARSVASVLSARSVAARHGADLPRWPPILSAQPRRSKARSERSAAGFPASSVVTLLRWSSHLAEFPPPRRS